MNEFFNNFNLLAYLIKKFKILAVVAVLTVIASAILTGPSFLKPMYKSTALIYPANLVGFSEESLTEQMLQIINSKDIKDSVIAKFDLGNRYEIDKESEIYQSSLLGLYNKNISVKKAKFESLEISVLDQHPDIAKLIADAILDEYNKKVRHMHLLKYHEAFILAEKQLNEKRNYLDSLKVRYNALAKDYALFDFDKQVYEIVRGELGTIDGNGAVLNRADIQKMKELMKQKGPELLEITTLYRNELFAFANFKTDVYDKAKYNIERTNLTYYHIITPAFAADKKSYPTRWLIVLVSAASIALFTLLIIAIFDNYGRFKELILSQLGQKE